MLQKICKKIAKEKLDFWYILSKLEIMLFLTLLVSYALSIIFQYLRLPFLHSFISPSFSYFAHHKTYFIIYFYKFYIYSIISISLETTLNFNTIFHTESFHYTANISKQCKKRQEKLLCFKKHASTKTKQLTFFATIHKLASMHSFCCYK